MKKNKIIKGGTYFKLAGSKTGLIAIVSLLSIISILTILAFVVHDQ